MKPQVPAELSCPKIGLHKNEKEMQEKRKFISGLDVGHFFEPKSKLYFTDTEKHQIIQDLLNSGKVYRTERRTRYFVTLDERIRIFIYR